MMTPNWIPRARQPLRRGAALLVAAMLSLGACSPAVPASRPPGPQPPAPAPASSAPPTAVSPSAAAVATPVPTATPVPVTPGDPCGIADPQCQSASAVQQKSDIPFTDPVTCAAAPQTVPAGAPSAPTPSPMPTAYCDLQVDSFAPRTGTDLPVVVMIPGGPIPLGNRGYMWALARLVAWKGAVVYTADYRSGPQWGGGYPQTFADVACAIAFARANAAKLGGDPSRVTLVAHSFGGFPGSVLALSRYDFAADEPACLASPASGRPNAFVGVAAIYGFDHIGADFLAQMLGGTRAEVPANWAATDITALATAKGHPTPAIALLAGTADEVAPITTADEFAAVLATGGIHATVTQVQGADHDSILTEPATLATITGLIGATGQ